MSMRRPQVPRRKRAPAANAPSRPAPRHIPGVECAVCGSPAGPGFRREAADEVFAFCSARCASLFDEAPDDYRFGRRAVPDD